MTTGQKVLAVGGIALGGYIVYKVISAKVSTPAVLGPAGGTGVSTSTWGAVGSFFGGLFSSPSKSGPNQYGAGAAGQGPVDPGPATYATEADRQAAAENYGYADSHPGAALPEGVYGPPVPSSVGSDSSYVAPTSEDA